MAFDRITDKAEIRKVMHAHMLAPEKQRAPFLATISTREHRPGGITFEGSRPLGSNTDDNDTTYTLTNMDSGYNTPIATVKLSAIEYVETLR